MTGEGRGGGAGEGPDGRSLPPELRGVDEELRRIRFGPRSGLEDEVLARLSDRGDGAASRRTVAGRAASGVRRAVRTAAVLALIAALGLLARTGIGGDGDSGAPVAVEHGDRPAPQESFHLRWGPDARVLALGSGSASEAAPEGRGLRCSLVDDRLGCRGTESGPARLATARGPAVLRDFCCLDYDGGGPADDGVRVVAGQGEAVVDFWIYEDLDGNGSFSDGDLLRTVVDGDRAGRPGAGTPGRVRQLDRCCADLDGGPHRDDGVFVMAAGGEHVALAILYEDVTGDRRLGPGDRLRALRTTPLRNGF